jgi:hypothetical protein
VSAHVSAKAISGERHLAARQAELFGRAEALAEHLARSPAVASVWLTGSVAKGHVDGASDLDLHVFTEGALEPNAAWRFAPGSAAENLHVFPAAKVREGAALLQHPPALAHWMASAGLADALTGARQLYIAAGAQPLASAIGTLVAARNRPDVQAELAGAFVDHGHRFLEQGRAAIAHDATLDAHQHLRTASQEVLVALLISRGWILRGSKKRLEIAQSYGVDVEATDTFDLFERINGLNGLTPSHAASICETRQNLRAVLALGLRDELAARGCEAEVVATRIAPYEAHNAGASNYYQPLLGAGIYRGPVNHIRAFSGFSRLPRLVMQTLGEASRYPITAWSKTDEGALKPARNLWFDISELRTLDTDVQYMADDLHDAADAVLRDLGLGLRGAT